MRDHLPENLGFTQSPWCNMYSYQGSKDAPRRIVNIGQKECMTGERALGDGKIDLMYRAIFAINNDIHKRT